MSSHASAPFVCLSQKQVESTISLQVLQPKIKELQAKFGSNQEQLQLETARLYR